VNLLHLNTRRRFNIAVALGCVGVLAVGATGALSLAAGDTGGSAGIAMPPLGLPYSPPPSLSASALTGFAALAEYPASGDVVPLGSDKLAPVVPMAETKSAFVSKVVGEGELIHSVQWDIDANAVGEALSGATSPVGFSFSVPTIGTVEVLPESHRIRESANGTTYSISGRLNSASQDGQFFVWYSGNRISAEGFVGGHKMSATGSAESVAVAWYVPGPASPLACGVE